MQNYSINQFNACAINPLVSGDLLLKHPHLYEVFEPEWAEDENFDRILRYVIAVYDPKSPLVAMERDLVRRKEAAIQLLDIDDELGQQLTTYSYGTSKQVAPAPKKDKKKKKDLDFDPLEDELEAEAAALIDVPDPWLSNMIFCYLKGVVKSRPWLTICALEFSFYENLRLLMQPIKDGRDKEVLESVQKKNAIKGEIENDVNRLDLYCNKFFGDSTLEEMVQKKKRFTPEGMVKNV
jgi:hypothetical protein